MATTGTFDARKRAIARELASAADDAEGGGDRSRAGRVDARCAALVREICASEDFFTTSSCSGRVSVFADRSAVDAREERKGGTWAYVSHDPANAREVIEAVGAHEGADADDGDGGDGERSERPTLVLRFEPFILAVEARDLERGAAFVRMARECGYRESGITACEKRVVCSVRCQLRMEAPVVVDGARVCADDAIEILVRVANEKFHVNAARMERFREAFREMCAKKAAGEDKDADGGAVATKMCLEVKKESAKAVKDALKRCKWLDLTRKAAMLKASNGDVESVVLPVKSVAALVDNADASSDDEKFVLLAIERGDAKLRDDGGATNGGLILAQKKQTQNPVTQMKQELSAMLHARGLRESLVQEVSTRWEKFGDLVLVPAQAFSANEFKSFQDDLYGMVARVLGVTRVARQAPVSQGPKRESRAVMMYPRDADGWVETKELGVTYGLDVTKVMFSSGNGTEKQRMANIGADGETIVDLFAGIGYYTLQLLKNAGAAKVYACEWNPNSCEALRYNLRVNGLESKCEVLEGDNRRVAPIGVADRVLLGLLPHAEMSWETALKALKPQGGVLHVHSNVNSGEEEEWTERLVAELKALATANGRDDWDVVVEHLERVKWYGPRIRHVVCDVRCTSRVTRRDEGAVGTVSPARSGSGLTAGKTPLAAKSRVDRLHRPDAQHFIKSVATKRVPIVLSGLDIGQAPWTWTPQYLSKLEGLPDKAVSVHVSQDPKLDFVRKNFTYQVMPFGELLDKVANDGGERFYYLRSIGENPRKEPAHAIRQFPCLEHDLKLPTELWGGEENYFSSVIRVSSGGLQLWTHYDAMDNMLIQLHGEKRVLLFPPSVSGDLYLEGSSSIVRDIDSHDPETFPRFARAREAALEVILQPGDVLYIPALWAHHVTALQGPSIAVNVFYRHLPTEMYPSKDLYGNADPVPAAEAMKLIDSAMESLKKLPHDYKVFYAGVASSQLENHLGVTSARKLLSMDDGCATRKSSDKKLSSLNRVSRALGVATSVGIAMMAIRKL